MYLLSLNRPYREFVIFTGFPEDHFILKTFQGMEGCTPKEKQITFPPPPNSSTVSKQQQGRITEMQPHFFSQ